MDSEFHGRWKTVPVSSRSPDLSKHWRFLAFWLSLCFGSFLLFLVCHKTAFLFSTRAMTALGWRPNAHRDMIMNRCSCHFLSENAKCLFMCYFTCQAQKNSIYRGFNLITTSWYNSIWGPFLVRSQASSSSMLDLFFRTVRAQIQDSWRRWIW